jgi:hypothetical protein
MAMDPSAAAGIMQSDYLQGGGGQDAANLAALRNQRLAELRRTLALNPEGAGGTTADATQLQNDINTDPNTGLAAQAATQKVTDQNAAATAYNQPSAAGQRADTQKAAVQLAQAPGVQAGANEQAVEAQKAASAEKIAAGNVVGRQGVADAKARTVAEAAANKATALPAQVQVMRAKADLILPSIPKINAEIDRLAPYIGAAGGRWSDFMAGTIGSTAFATDDQDAHDLNQLRTALTGLSAGVAMTHGRGGANMGLVNEYNKQLSIGHDPALLHGAVDGFKDILRQYSTPPAAVTTPAGGVVPPGGVTPPQETPDARKARLTAALGAQ